MPPGVRPEVIPAVLLFGIFRVGMHHLIVKVPDAFLRGALLNLPQSRKLVNRFFNFFLRYLRLFRLIENSAVPDYGKYDA